MKTSDLASKTKENCYNSIIRRCKVIARAFTVPNDDLFNHKKPIVIDQFPTVFDTLEKQTLSTAVEIIKKLTHNGLSVDDIKQSELFYYNIRDGIAAFDALKKDYPGLANITTLKQWTSKRVDENSKVFMTIIARKKSPTKKESRL